MLVRITPKPYYRREGICIYHGNCDTIVPYLRGIGAVFTDPPYGINVNVRDKSFAPSSYGSLSTAYPKILGDDQPFDPRWITGMSLPTCLWGANYYAYRLPPSGAWLVWDKRKPMWNSQSQCELAWTNFSRGTRIFSHLWHGCNRDSEAHEYYHPAQKPVKLWAWVLSNKWLHYDGIVLDPYTGSGSLLLACIHARRPAIGIELSEAYCKVAAARCELEFKERHSFTSQ